MCRRRSPTVRPLDSNQSCRAAFCSLPRPGVSSARGGPAKRATATRRSRSDVIRRVFVGVVCESSERVPKRNPPSRHIRRESPREWTTRGDSGWHPEHVRSSCGILPQSDHSETTLIHPYATSICSTVRNDVTRLSSASSQTFHQPQPRQGCWVNPSLRNRNDHEFVETRLGYLRMKTRQVTT